MEPITLKTAALWAGAADADALPDTAVTDITRNTKTLIPGALFVPLKGAKADGHTYIPAAEAAGACAALCARDDVRAGIPLLRVPDTLTAAQKLAAGYRTRMGKPVIGVTGSAGKTTTAAMIRCVLERKLSVVTTPPDDNGQIGLTFGVFALEKRHDAAVWEMGMSQYGELSRLSRMARPDIAVINGIGTAHIEFFGSRENILKAKLEITDGMGEKGILVLNGDDDLLRGLSGLPLRVLYYGLDDEKADVRGEILRADGLTQTLRITFPGGAVIERVLPAAGRHNASNALAAAAVGALMGLEPAQIAFDGFEGVGGRQNIVEKYGLTVMEDWYNASPEAVQAALSVLAGLAKPGGRRYAVLGCMKELGDSSPALHRLCGERAAACADVLWVYGEGAEAYLEGAEAAGMPAEACALFDSHDALAAALKSAVRPGDALLFKGAHHATHMEYCMQKFYALMEAQ